MIQLKKIFLYTILISIIWLTVFCKPSHKGKEILNVSYDPTREFYKDFNKEFITNWKKETGEDVFIKQSHGGSGKQARSVIDGLEADIVTLALAYDIDEISKLSGFIPQNWQSRLPQNSSPYTSRIVFLVRKGNPKGIKDWDDLIKPGIQIITPNPKTSGGARWNYLSAWGYALKQKLGDFSKTKDTKLRNEAEEYAKSFVSRLFKNVPVLDSGARGATSTFIQRNIGDVLISWENEAFLSIKEFGENQFEIIVPSLSILAEPPVSIVDKNADKHGTRKIAEAYLKYLYTPQAQRLAAKHFYRPVNWDGVDSQDKKRFPEITTFTIDEVFGGWESAQKTHFSDKGIFDQIYLSQGKN